MSTTGEITVRAYTTKELAALYGISSKTIKTWLQPYTAVIGEKRGRYYTTLQVRTIFEKIGEP
jgi:transposase